MTFEGFPTEEVDGKVIIDIVPERVVAIVEDNSPFVRINALKYPYDDRFEYDSVTLTKDQLQVLAKQVKEMK